MADQNTPAQGGGLSEQQLTELAEALKKLQPYLENQQPAQDPNAQATPPAAPPAAPPVQQPQQTPISVTLPNGQVIQAASQEELNRQLGVVFEQIQREQAAQNVREPATPNQPAWKAPTMAQKEQYAKMFLENPFEATVYALKEVTGWEDPVDVLRTAVQSVYEQQEAMAIQQFLVRNKDYVPGQQNLAVMDNLMRQNGWTSNVANLEAAWEMAKKYNMAQLTPAQPAQQAQVPQQPQFQPQSPAQTPGAPPPIPRAAAGATNADLDAMSAFEELPADQMREVLMRWAGQK